MSLEEALVFIQKELDILKKIRELIYSDKTVSNELKLAIIKVYIEEK